MGIILPKQIKIRRLATVVHILNTIVSNRLAEETSPYLLQHANNPVNWFPWGEEAFQKAKEEDKPIFLSIGYSTCHWCHVMERECFENKEVAELMNNAFINIKVDREERPDVDSVYMDICQALTGSGGWPLTIIMTPDQKPFFAGTYIPRNSQNGRTGMLELVPQIQGLWKNERKKVVDAAEHIVTLITKEENKRWENNLIESTLENEDVHDIIKKTFEELEYSFDNKMGGFGGAPKFPTPHRLYFLLRYWRHTGKLDALDMVNKTLNNMRMGGVFDQIGYGFHRYSTDAKWLVPHFEKMLYDQALMTIAYIEAYQITKDETFKETAQEILEYVARDLMDKEGAFYCAEDADSEGVEGKFYVWTEEEIDSLLKDKAEYAKNYFCTRKEGNFKDEATNEMTGNNILYVDRDDKLLMIEKDKIKKIRKILSNEREKRVRPALDDKILTDWNGLMIKAFAMAGKVFENEEYTGVARKACNFFLESIEQNNGLLHRCCKDKWDIKAHLDDYAFFIEGLIELYQTTFDEKYKKKAIQLTVETIDLFWDHETAGFYFTSKEGEQLIMRKKQIYDGAIPSGNSVMLSNLLKLSALSDNEDLSQKSSEMINYFIDEVKRIPTGYTQLICGLLYAFGSSGEITIMGDMERTETKEMLKSLSQEYLPNIMLKFNKTTDKPMATLCLNKTCGEATTDVNQLLDQLRT